MEETKVAYIIGMGSYVPERILSNKDLEKIVDTSDEWIFSRTGMKERRIAAQEEHTSVMGERAAKKALERAGMSASEVDLILFATITPDYGFPSTACLVQRRLKAKRAAAVDVQAACSGFIYALSMAKAYIISGMYKRVLVIAAEKLSSIVDYTDRNTCILFGDGAAAAVLSSQGFGLAVSHVCLGADGVQADLLTLPAGGCRYPASTETVQNKQHYLQMEGREVFKHAVRRMEQSCKECLEACHLEEKEVDWLVAHQANIRIIEALAKRFSVPKSRVFLTIHKYGNTSAASVAIALDELCKNNKMRHKENILLTAFGAGLTFGSALLTYMEK